MGRKRFTAYVEDSVTEKNSATAAKISVAQQGNFLYRALNKKQERHQCWAWARR